MRSLSLALVAVLSIVGTPSRASAADAFKTPEDAARAYFRSEAQFDLDGLKAVLDPNFVEVSPLGEIDEYARVLSFYAPDKKIAAPPVTFDPYQVRMHGETAVITTHASFSVQGQTRTMTVGLVAHRIGNAWKMLSAQYTPVRQKKVQPPVSPAPAH